MVGRSSAQQDEDYQRTQRENLGSYWRTGLVTSNRPSYWSKESSFWMRGLKRRIEVHKLEFHNKEHLNYFYFFVQQEYKQLLAQNSERFQWLPTLLENNQDSMKYEIKSYINNLHPTRHASLYNSIESIFNSILPGLNYTLSSSASKPYVRIEIPDYDEIYLAGIEEKLDEYYGDTDERELDIRKRYLKKFIPEFKGGPVFDKKLDLEKDFHKVKVIVKLANIELTPENPSYGGGSWHVEGFINEDIVATVLYYYDTFNITESKLNTGFEEPKYEHNDDFHGTAIYGLNPDDRLVKEMGNIIAIEDRVAIFPNIYQPQVDSFELADKTKKGHRKIMCFFVVDPYIDLVVTSDQVLPQQQEWWNDGLVSDELKESILAIKDKSP